ncbi:MAG TPA: hypothetical protein VJ208_00670 [Candidatus Nanoarchaeia archaeon]|nr:hypothetical protein [Candidatus Nanoarchaeia archaeon]
MITYNDIYDAVRRERIEELQPLPKNFLEEFSDYVREKKEISSKDDDFSESSIKVKKQLENTRTLFKELILRRRKKILNLLLIAAETGISKRDSENMLDFEKKMFDELIKCVALAEGQVNSVYEKQKEKIAEKQPVVFKKNVDEFVGFNSEMLGPFKEGDKAELEEEIAKILIEDGKAELVI